MNQFARRKWKGCLIRIPESVIVLLGLLSLFAFTRLHFAHQMSPFLARLQGNTRPRLERLEVRPEIIGHRGSGIKAAETQTIIGNTDSAIRTAIEAGVDWIEIDIRRSADKHLVVFHDERIDRKTTGVGSVSDLHLDQLQSVEVMVDPRERILSLDEVYQRYHSGNRKWVLDIKQRGIKDQVVPWIHARLSAEQVIVIGTEKMLSEYRDCGYALGYVAPWGDGNNRLRVLFAPGEVVDRCQALGCDYLIFPVVLADQSLVEEANSEGISVWMYGTENEIDLTHAAARGIRGLIVDHPGKAIGLFDGIPRNPKGARGNTQQ